MNLPFLNEFAPDPEGMLRSICERIDDSMLEEISFADGGEEQADHLAALRRIRDDPKFPKEMGWCPREVVELIRWSTPEYPEWRPGGRGERGHWMRAFACTTLLRGAIQCSSYDWRDEPDHQTLIQLILSLRELSFISASQGASFIAWLLANVQEDHDDASALGFGLLWFALHMPVIAHQTLDSLTQWLKDRQLGELARYSRIEWLQHSLKVDEWKKFGMALGELDLTALQSEVRISVKLLTSVLLTPHSRTSPID